MANQDGILKQINRSGFPFQLKIEHEVRSTYQDHHWSIATREHPWTNDDATASGFVDIVLERDACRLVVECKRNKADDARQLRWVFLLPDQKGKTKLASCLEVGREGDGADFQIWDNVYIEPSSLQSGFCILQSDEARRQPILESLAAEVLESIEGVAKEEINIARSHNSGHIRLFIVPVIVTNAEIAVCRFDSSLVKIDDGTLERGDVDISPVHFIRFRKSLATKFPQGSFRNLQSANEAREQTVFVVNAAALPEFLKDWNLYPRDGRYAIQGLLDSRGRI